MASSSPLLTLVSQYELMAIVAKHLHYFELHNLAALNSSFRREMKELGKPPTTQPDQRQIDSAAASASAATTTTTITVPNSRSECAAQKPGSYWKMLAQFTDRNCQEALHEDKWAGHTKGHTCQYGTCPYESVPADLELIRHELGIKNQLNQCRSPGCGKAVCFGCWWVLHCSNHLNRRGGGRSRNYCKACFDTKGILTVQDGVPAATTRTRARVEGQFCQCGPAFFCSDCYSETDVFGRPLDAERERRWEEMKEWYSLRYNAMMSNLKNETIVRSHMDPTAPSLWERLAPGSASHQTCWSCKKHMSKEEFESFSACRLCSLPVATSPRVDILDPMLWPRATIDEWRTLPIPAEIKLKDPRRHRNNPSNVRENLDMKLRHSSAGAIAWIKLQSRSHVFPRIPAGHRLRLVGDTMWEPPGERQGELAEHVV